MTGSVPPSLGCLVDSLGRLADALRNGDPPARIQMLREQAAYFDGRFWEQFDALKRAVDECEPLGGGRRGQGQGVSVLPHHVDSV